MAGPVGIIGSACRFPGDANSPAKLWELLKSPRDVLSTFSQDRLNLQSFYHQNGEHHGSTDVQNKGYLLSEDIRLFDASFFRISPSEAAAMDPQQRILLETVYEALESAGCPLDQLQASVTSVWAGLMNGDFADIQARDLETLPTQHATGTHRSILSNRISYFFDLQGPSMTIDTACSSSLVALHQAVLSLRSGESDMAIVAGANLILDPAMYVAESKLHMLSPESRSRMWDKGANGYARGEGFAAIVLQRLGDAVRDGNHIECVVRGTAVNSDGRGKGGITVPSAAAQTTLIRQAYRDAGLDARLDRCHFFEAHGTGTQAGDPVEAQAIRDAFFPPGESDGVEVPPGRLQVGSIKTVIGHLEGCAGLAGVLKASLAIQHRTIPPNMFFSELNPTVAPFYDHLEIPTEQGISWPELKPGMPLRASVNSFGFGGTNAHVILESYQEEEKLSASKHAEEERFVGPLVFSANSKESLARSVQAHIEEIRRNESLDLQDLAWTLQYRRTHFDNSRAVFSGATREKLLSNMDAFVADAAAGSSASTGTADPPPPIRLGDDGPALLGIFTGQGAQWASMGRNLILHSNLFRESIERCEKSLGELGSDAPKWSLKEELLAGDATSRVAEAALSQPLCTAVQIGLVDLLQASGISFRAVVGHSSGEIAAAYAAGILPNPCDAIRIAYYRGMHATKLAAGSEGKVRGAMLAAGLSFDDASELCARPEWAGRICVAADNSSTSVTLSGDDDVVDQVKAHLDAEGTFARKLKVDMAYHSHHMEACASAYMASLQACNIQVQQPPNGCVWVSSVRGDIDSVLAEDEDDGLEVVRDQYWVDNLTNPVLFGPAVECALWRGGPFDMVVEVGPHPALKGPATQTFKASLGASLPYFGVMQRGADEVEAFSAGLGYLWEHFGPAALIDFDGYRKAFSAVDSTSAEIKPPRLIKGLPAYNWDHAKVHWRESQLSRNFRLADRPCHDLLGRRAPDDTPGHLRWRNLLRLDEIEWVKGHMFQGQVILPGVSYLSAITEAIEVITGGSPVKLVDICDVVLHKAVVLRENRACEFITDLRVVNRGLDVISAEFSFSTTQSDSDAAPETTCSGRIEVQLGRGEPDAEEALLPPQTQSPPNLSAVDVDMFYASLNKLGLAFSGPFHGTKSAQRSLGYASTLASWDANNDIGSSADAYALHPAVLDSALHSLFAAFASPATEQMWTPYLPVAFRRVSIVPHDCPGPFVASSAGNPQINASVSAQVTSSSPKGFEGDIQVTFGDSGRVAVQVEGVELRAMADQAGSAGDRVLFSHIKWDTDISTGVNNVILEKETTEQSEILDRQAVEAMGRTALYYYRTLLEQLSPREIKDATWHHQMFVESAQHWVEEVRTGRHPTIRSEWLEDTRETVWALGDKFLDRIDIVLMREIGENVLQIVRGETQPLEVMMKDDMLTRFYVEGHGLDRMNDHIARAVGQIAHRYPQANILEIGAGTGGTTRKVLRTIDNAYGHYTYTDISPGFFERAADKFSDPVRQRKMTFKVLDIEKDVLDQGFAEGSFDIIVAANVIHATQYLEDTMRQVRRLLKPGGYLVMMEVTGDLLRLGLILGILSGWWLGPQVGDESRQWGPGISTTQWDDLLRRTGFSGVDHNALESPTSKGHYLSMLVSQATDDRVDQLRYPLKHIATLPMLPDTDKLLIIGGETPTTAKLAKDLKLALASWGGTTIEAVTSFDQLAVASHEHVSAICLAELDQPLFGNGNMTEARLQRIQDFLQRARSVLWVTAGCRGPNPEANMFSGIARAIRAEQPDINLQLLDVGAKPEVADTNAVAEAFVRLALTGPQGITSQPDRQRLLWATETEIALDFGSLLIPRLIPGKAQNERYNAVRRAVTKQISVETDTDWEYEVECSTGTLSLTGVEPTLSRRVAKASNSTSVEKITIDVQLSVALTQPENRYFLCYGSIAESTSSNASHVFAVTRSNKSVALVNADNTIPFLHEDTSSGPSSKDQASKVLEALAGQIMARSIIPRVPRHGSILFYEPAEPFVQAIGGCQLWKDRQVYYATSSLSATVVPKGWISIDLRALDSSLRQMVPEDVTAMIDFSIQGNTNDRDLQSCLPADCVTVKFEPAFLEIDSGALGHAYTDAVAVVKSEAAVESDRAVQLISRSTLLGRPSSSIAYPSIVDWRAQDKDGLNGSNNNNSVAVQVKPLSTDGIFSSSKTHLMVGLNGDLGQSICGFMGQNGARHIAIASRSGEVNPEWLETMQNQQVNVRVYKMDVTKKEDIQATIERIHNDGMPPIGGVANGSLVLRDKLFLNMDIDSMNETLQSKVDGSRNLDELFSTGLAATQLDYFVLFSSLATMAGNAGQSSYHAANMFMTALAANRRDRGLTGSVMHVAVVADAGYVTRQSGQLLEHLRRQFFTPTSETDAHQLFAEAVLASPANSGLQADICMGLELFPDRPDDADLVRPSWFKDSRLSHFVFIKPNEDDQAAGRVKDGDALPLNQRIDGAGSLEAAVDMVQEAFSIKLETLMQLDTGSVDVHAPPLKLGFDSLLAVETRSWFLKEVSVDVPVLRFLGEETIHEICADAASQYFSLRGTTGSDAGEGLETNATTKSSVTDDSASSSDHPPPISSPASLASLDMADPHDLKPDALMTTGISPLNQSVQSTKSPQVSRNTTRVEKLSYLQARLWALGQYLGDPTATNIAVSYNIVGPLDVRKLHEALIKVVSHHPTLRTSFYPDDDTGEPVQGLLRQLPSSDLFFKETTAATRANGIIDQEFNVLKQHIWDLPSGESFGSTLVYVEDEAKYVLIFGYHLVVMDGFSWSVFLRDLGRAYATQPLSRQTKLCMDAAVEERRAVESMSGAMHDSISFWEKLYTTLPEPMPFLPITSTTHRQPLVGYVINRVIRDIESPLLAKIKDACRTLRVTPFQFHLATVQAMFAKLLPQIPELCIGIFDANRSDDGSLNDAIGYFVNVLPLRFRLDDKQQVSFAEVVRRTSAHVLEARHHGGVPFDVLLDRLKVPDDKAVSPLCQVAFNYRAGTMTDVGLGNSKLAVDNFSDAQNRYDFSWGFYEDAAGSVAVHITCKNYAYDQAATQFIIDTYIHLLDALASDASRTIPDYPLPEATTKFLESRVQ